ncbi:MAG: hypothetical protein ACOC5T_06500 [Elusimicrobiota bacterium]
MINGAIDIVDSANKRWPNRVLVKLKAPTAKRIYNWLKNFKGAYGTVLKQDNEENIFKFYLYDGNEERKKEIRELVNNKISCTKNDKINEKNQKNTLRINIVYHSSIKNYKLMGSSVEKKDIEEIVLSNLKKVSEEENIKISFDLGKIYKYEDFGQLENTVNKENILPLILVVDDDVSSMVNKRINYNKDGIYRIYISEISKRYQYVNIITDIAFANN